MILQMCTDWRSHRLYQGGIYLPKIIWFRGTCVNMAFPLEIFTKLSNAEFRSHIYEISRKSESKCWNYGQPLVKYGFCCANFLRFHHHLVHFQMRVWCLKRHEPLTQQYIISQKTCILNHSVVRTSSPETHLTHFMKMWQTF